MCSFPSAYSTIVLLERCGLTQTWDDKDEDIVTGGERPTGETGGTANINRHLLV